MTTSLYTNRYTFNGYLRGEYSKAISLIDDTVAEMQREGTDIEFRGATQEINAEGQLIEVTARYAAPSKGTVGRLNCRACLPASGSPQRERTEDRRMAVTTH